MKILSQDGMMLTESENINIYVDKIMGSTDRVIKINGNVYGKYDSEESCKSIIDIMFDETYYKMPEYNAFIKGEYQLKEDDAYVGW